MNDRWRLYTIPILKEENYRWSDSWTSISDIGRIYNGHEFTYEDYFKTEQSYVRLLVSMFEYLHAKRIRLVQLDVYDNSPIAIYDKDGKLREWHDKVKNNMSLSLHDLQYVIPLILRENMWGTLYHKRTKTYVHFGYDYYVYVNSPELFQIVDGKDVYNPDFVKMVNQNKLFLD